MRLSRRSLAVGYIVTTSCAPDVLDALPSSATTWLEGVANRAVASEHTGDASPSPHEADVQARQGPPLHDESTYEVARATRTEHTEHHREPPLGDEREDRDAGPSRTLDSATSSE